MKKSNRYTIGEMSKITGLSITALRFYDKKKLFQPEIRDNFTNYRYYSEKQIPVGISIYEYRQVGFSVETMKAMLSDLNIKSMMEFHIRCLDLLEEEIQIKQRQIHRLKNIYQQTVGAMQDFQPDLPLKDRVVISTYPASAILFNRTKSELFSENLWWDRYLELLKIRDREGLTVCGPLTAIFHVDYSERFSLLPGDLELFFPIYDMNIKSPNIRYIEDIPTASVVVQGEHKNFFAAYTNLLEAISQEKYCVVGPPMEEYLIELPQTRNPEEYITRIHLPVKKIGSVDGHFVGSARISTRSESDPTTRNKMR